jgi:endo-1,4-beta-xylanase
MSKNSKKAALFVKLVSLAVLIAMLQSMLYLPALAAPTGQRLRALVGSSFLIGYAAATNFNNRSDSATYQSVASSEFNFVTPENAMKWDALQPTQGNFSFGNADALVTFAQANTQKIHGHTLVWHSQLPSWVASAGTNSTTLTNVMNTHITTVMNHWPDGTIYAWDVVNEAFNEDGTRRSSPFQNVIGNGYIETAFRTARAADATTKLIYNDYNVETVNSKSTAMYNMVADFKNRGVPIDGVGLQMHLTSGGLDYNSLASNMARFAALGVEIYITEMDVRLTTPASQTDLSNQATIYANVLARCRAQPMCKGFQVWGIPDKDSWVMSTFPGTGVPLLFDDNFNAKPAYYSVQSGLGGTTPTATLTRTNTPPAVTNTPTRTLTRTVTPNITNTGTRPATTVAPTFTRTRTPTATGTGGLPTIPPPTNTLVPTNTAAPTSSGGTCSPVSATITAPFTKDGVGTLCWQSSNLGSYINSWNTSSVTINGVNITNLYMASGSYPVKIGGFWYVTYNGPYAWSHFEAK